MREQKLDRRALLQAGLAGGALAITGPSARAFAPETASSRSTADAVASIPARPFGKTGRVLPVLGHGGSAMAQRFQTKYRLPEGSRLGSLEERAEMVRHAYDLGVRYFDTARGYGESESIMGAALEGVDDAFLATKVAVMKPEDVRQSVETSLSELRRTKIDAMQIHSPTIERLGYDGAMKVYEELARLRDEGLFDFIGLTTHVAFETVHRMISTGGFDQVLLARGYFPIGLNKINAHRNVEWRELCVAKAHELGMAIVIMKVLGAAVFGHSSRTLVPDYDEEKRAQLPAAAIRWVLSDTRVSMLNIGMTFPGDVVANREIVATRQELSEDERTLLADFSRHAYESDFIRSMPIAS